MKKLIIIFLVLAALTTAGCSGNNAKELLETAQLEELQNNHEHARKLYRQIIEKHPESKYAEKARERLDALNRPGD